MKAPIAMLALIVSLYGFSPVFAITPEESGRPIAEADIGRWNSAISQGDLDNVASLFTHDAMLIQPNGKVVRDGGQIRAFWKSLLETQQGLSRLALVKARRENEDTVVTRAVLSDSKTMGKPDEVMSYNYQGVVNNVLRRQADGGWKVQVQRWNDGSLLGGEKGKPAP